MLSIDFVYQPFTNHVLRLGRGVDVSAVGLKNFVKSPSPTMWSINSLACWLGSSTTHIANAVSMHIDQPNM